MKNEKIGQYIFDEYIFNRELKPIQDELNNYDLLVENNLASVLRFTGYNYSSSYLSDHNLACYFICKYNKKIKKRLIPDTENIDYPNTAKEVKEVRSYILGAGMYYAELKNENFLVLSVKDEKDRDNFIMKKTTLYFIGKDHIKYRDKFFKMKEKYMNIEKKSSKETVIRSACEDGKRPKYVTFKSFDQYVYKDKEKLIKYIDHWVENIPLYYNKYHMIPRLSFLLYGKPGTGKTTFYQVLADYLEIDTIVSIDPFYFMDSSRKLYLGNTTPRIYTIDEIDMFCRSRNNDEDKEEKLENGRILSSLLAFLDAPDTFYFKAKDGIHYPVSIVVATTNYYDRLDDAVKRYGRFDKKIEMKYFDKSEAEEMCKLYDLTLKDVIEGDIDENFSIAPSELQTKCLENIDKALKK